MGKYIHKFDSAAELEAEYGKRNYLEPWVSYTEENEEVKYNISEQESLNMPFTVNILSEGTITWQLNDKVVLYSKNEESWKTMSSTTIINVVEGDEIRFKGSNSNYNGNTFQSSAQFYVSGNIMSLIDQDNFSTLKTVEEFAFRRLFWSNQSLLYADKLLLPALTLATSCYEALFGNCSSLTKAPKLPAMVLQEACYKWMFDGCIKLRKSPKLPATTLARSCYYCMFGSSGLFEAPELPATELAEQCYIGMFYHSHDLRKAMKILPAMTLTEGCYVQMFEECLNLTNAPELPATNLAQYCYYYMFRDCNHLTDPPELPATVLASHCYDSMFAGANITRTPELPATVLASSCYENMFTSCIYITNAPVLNATTLAENCYLGMFYGCRGLINIQDILPATTLVEGCYQEMFYNCENITRAPDLPARELVNHCYEKMFYSCSKLNYIKAMFITTPSEDYTTSWLSFTANRGTFIKNSEATWDVVGWLGVPTNWTIQTSSV